MNTEAILSELVGEMFPDALAIGPRLRRNWVVRAVKPLPSQAVLLTMQQSVEDSCFKTIQDAYIDGVVPDRLNRTRPSIFMVRLDDLHLLIRIDFAGPDISVGDAAMIAQWGVLQAIDLEIEIDDLQGLPRKSWFLLSKELIRGERGDE
jgi:hypothetical protein